MSRLKNFRNGWLVGNINFFIGVLCPFIIRTIMIQYLGNEYLGLNSLFSSILQVLSLTELGIGSSISFFLYKPLATNDTKRINSILYFYKVAYKLIGLLILFVSFIINCFLSKLIHGDIPSNINKYILFWIYVINTVVSYFLFAYKKILLSASQRYDKEMLVSIITSLFKYLLQILVLIIFKNYYAYVVIFPISTVLDNFICALVVKRIFPDYKADGKLDKPEIIQILKNTGGAFCSKIGATVYLSVDNIVISSFLGLFILGTYNNYYYVISIFTMMFAVVHNAIRPVIGNSLAIDNKDKNWNKFKIINTLYMMTSIIICSVCIGMLQKFEILWGGKVNSLGNDISILLVLNFYISRMIAIPIIYLEASGILWQGRFVPLISAGLNLIINIILVNLIGLPGIIISSIIAASIVSLPGYTMVIKKQLFNENNYTSHYISSQFIFFVQFVIIGSICWSLNLYVFISTSIIGFIVEGILLCALSLLLVIVFNCRRKELYTLKSLIFNKIKR